MGGGGDATGTGVNKSDVLAVTRATDAFDFLVCVLQPGEKPSYLRRVEAEEAAAVAGGGGRGLPPPPATAQQQASLAAVVRQH